MFVIISLFHLYGRETWSVVQGKNEGLFENRVLRRTLGPKEEEVITGRRKLHNVEPNDLFAHWADVR